ncbi:MAG: hypothetical protein ABEI76_04285 [Halobacteriales archaeon]
MDDIHDAKRQESGPTRNLCFSNSIAYVVTNYLHVVFNWVKWVIDRLIDPLRTNDDLENFRLSVPETHTTTIDGDTGWAKRPPAVVKCSRCESEIAQKYSRDDIDCPRCVAEYDYDEFTDLELVYMECPVCQSRMQHGQRHPDQFDVPEWATCDNCRYHWEFRHSFKP